MTTAKISLAAPSCSDFGIDFVKSHLGEACLLSIGRKLLHGPEHSARDGIRIIERAPVIYEHCISRHIDDIQELARSNHKIANREMLDIARNQAGVFVAFCKDNVIKYDILWVWQNNTARWCINIHAVLLQLRNNSLYRFGLQFKFGSRKDFFILRKNLFIDQRANTTRENSLHHLQHGRVRALRD